MKLKRLVLVIFLIVQTKIVISQPYYFRRYQVEDGLSNNAVLCSLQDRDGFMWFGTKDGLNRFDGYTFKVFRNDADDSTSLGGSFIQCLTEDARGQLWVGTEKGLYRYNRSKENFSRLKNSNHAGIGAIHSDRSGNLWFISGADIWKYSVSSGQFKNYTAKHHLPASAITASRNGQLWFATVDGKLAQFREQTDDFSTYSVFEHSAPTTSKRIECLFDTGNGALLVGTSNQGVKIFDLQRRTYRDVLTHNQDHTEIYARSFLKQTDELFWVGTESGIYILNIETGEYKNLKKQFNDPYSLSDNAIYFLTRDREGGIWASTYFGGVNYYPRQYSAFEKFYHKVGENSISGNAVREISPDPDQNLWIGTEDAGLNKLDLKTGKISNYKPDGSKGSIAHSNIHGLFADSSEIWIGTFEHGLDVMDRASKKVIRHYSIGPGPKDLKSNFVYCIYKTRENQILIATTKGLYAFNRKEDNFDPVGQVPGHIFFTGILEDSEGTIWLSTIKDGLYFYNTRKKTSGAYQYDALDKGSLIDNRVTRIMEDSDRNIWVATEGGLCRFDKNTKKFKRYTIKDGFPSNVIYGMLEDQKKNLWISTSKGLLKFNPENKSIKIFTKSDGLLSDQFNYSSSYKDHSGTMYFGSVKGLIRFNPDDFRPDDFKPPVFITGIQVNNRELEINADKSPLKQSILLTSKIALDHHQSSFSIDFAALSYTSPMMTEYAYRMDGIDKDWIYLKQNRKVYFTDLSPGNYIFRVKASNSSGIWNTKETLLHVRVLPPWWGSKVAYLIYIALGGLVFFAMMKRSSLKMERDNQRRMEVFESEKEKEIYHAKIEFFTNIAHEIRTPLTLIKGPMEKMIKRAGEVVPDMEKNLRRMNKNTDRLLELTNQLLDFRKTETTGFSLNFVKANVGEIVRDISSNFQPMAEQHGITYTLQLTAHPVMAYIDLEAFHKIISNLIENALKYCESSICINMSLVDQQKDLFSVRVVSDGKKIPAEFNEKIFEPFFRTRDADVKTGAGIGLSLSRSLAELHNGTLVLDNSESDFNIFVLSLPIHQQIEFNLSTKWKKA